MYIGYPSTTVYPNNYIYPSPTPFSILVYDRTQADVDARNTLHDKVRDGTATAAEIVEWNACTAKGAYNYTDLNRVGNFLNLIQTMGTEKGFTVTYPYTVKTDWTTADMPTATDIAQLLENVLTVKTVFSRWITTTVPSAISKYDDANAVEYILFQVEAIYSGIEQSFQYSSNYTYAGGEQ